MLTGTAGLIENQIKSFIRHNVCLVDKENGRCKKLVLRHLNVDKKPQGDVHTINIGSDPALEGLEMVDKVILEVADYAQRDANDQQSGVQTYAVFAYYTVNLNYVPRKIFRVAAEDEIERDTGPSEPPSEKGLLMQLMRHNEVNSKNSMVGMGYILATLQKENQQLREHNRLKSENEIDNLILVQELLNDGHKRKIEEKQSEIFTGMLEGSYEHLKVLLPIIANRVAGTDVFPPTMDREMYLLSSFLENLSPEQQAFMQKDMSPAQLTLLGELLGLYEKRKHKLNGEKGNEENEKTKDRKSVGPASVGRLLKLFEKRSELVKGDAVDESSKRISEIETRLGKGLEKLKKSMSDNKDRNEPV